MWNPTDLEYKSKTKKLYAWNEIKDEYSKGTGKVVTIAQLKKTEEHEDEHLEKNRYELDR